MVLLVLYEEVIRLFIERDAPACNELTANFKKIRGHPAIEQSLAGMVR